LILAIGHKERVHHVKSARNALGSGLAALAAWVGFCGAASAAAPTPWQTGFQPAATPIMRELTSLHDTLLVIITLITLFVLGLLIYVVWRFSEKRNPTPSKTSHNTVIEILWTVIPVLILVFIAVPSFALLYHAEVIPKADMTIKATGHQWYWEYQYPDHGEFSFDSNMVEAADLKPGQKRLLEVDNRIVVPVNKTVRVIVTAAPDGVLHAWAVPAFGVKIDAVPGRLNETWFRAEREGTYYGQCSELCGVRHGFMPIRVDVVSESAFQAWLVKAKEEFAAAPSAPAGNTEIAAAVAAQ
jgi:cytochrome c oxidase subunit 2